MGKRGKARPKLPPRTPANALLVRRITDEMKKRRVNPFALGDYGVKQRTLADILRGSDPQVSTVYAVARAMGLETWELLKEDEAAAQNDKVVEIGASQPALGRSHSAEKATPRKNHRR